MELERKKREVLQRKGRVQEQGGRIEELQRELEESERGNLETERLVKQLQQDIEAGEAARKEQVGTQEHPLIDECVHSWVGGGLGGLCSNAFVFRRAVHDQGALQLSCRVVAKMFVPIGS